MVREDSPKDLDLASLLDSSSEESSSSVGELVKGWEEWEGDGNKGDRRGLKGLEEV